jgi:hypothetical protein
LLKSDEQVEARPGVAAELSLTADQYARLRELLKALRNKFAISNAGADHFARLMSMIATIIDGLRTAAEGNITKGENVDEVEKWAVVALGIFIVIFAIGASARNPQNLAGNVAWATYFLYRLQESARDPEHSLDITLNLLSQAGTTVVFTFFTVYVLLLHYGPKAFDDQTLFITSISLQLFFNATVAHRLGPLISPALRPVVNAAMRFFSSIGKKFRKTGSDENIAMGRLQPQQSPTPTVETASVEIVPEIPNIAAQEDIDDLIEDFLTAGKPADIADTLSALDIKNDVKELKRKPDQDAMSALDIMNDVKKLQCSPGEDEYARLQSFLKSILGKETEMKVLQKIVHFFLD